MNKLSWACSDCGMSSSRKSSVVRHIDTFHASDYQNLVTYNKYLAGLKIGIYIPDDLTFKKKEPDFETIMKEEFCRETARIYARSVVVPTLEMIKKKMTTGEMLYAKFESQLSLKEFHRVVRDMVAEMHKK